MAEQVLDYANSKIWPWPKLTGLAGTCHNSPGLHQLSYILNCQQISEFI